jgi:hypothetical protein
MKQNPEYLKEEKKSQIDTKNKIIKGYSDSQELKQGERYERYA